MKSLPCPKLESLYNGYIKAKSFDGLWRFPSDSIAWEHIENVLEFENEDSANIQTRIAIDGINL